MRWLAICQGKFRELDSANDNIDIMLHIREAHVCLIKYPGCQFLAFPWRSGNQSNQRVVQKGARHVSKHQSKNTALAKLRLA